MKTANRDELFIKKMFFIEKRSMKNIFRILKRID